MGGDRILGKFRGFRNRVSFQVYRRRCQNYHRNPVSYIGGTTARIKVICLWQKLSACLTHPTPLKSIYSALVRYASLTHPTDSLTKQTTHPLPSNILKPKPTTYPLPSNILKTQTDNLSVANQYSQNPTNNPSVANQYSQNPNK
jgi:hypothetical protein